MAAKKNRKLGSKPKPKGSKAGKSKQPLKKIKR